MTTPLTTAAAAKALGLSLRTVQAHIAAGNLHAEWSDLARRYLIAPGELERFRRENRKPGGQKKAKNLTDLLNILNQPDHDVSKPKKARTE